MGAAPQDAEDSSHGETVTQHVTNKDLCSLESEAWTLRPLTIMQVQDMAVLTDDAKKQPWMDIANKYILPYSPELLFWASYIDDTIPPDISEVFQHIVGFLESGETHFANLGQVEAFCKAELVMMTDRLLGKGITAERDLNSVFAAAGVSREALAKTQEHPQIIRTIAACAIWLNDALGVSVNLTDPAHQKAMLDWHQLVALTHFLVAYELPFQEDFEMSSVSMDSLAKEKGRDREQVSQLKVAVEELFQSADYDMVYQMFPSRSNINRADQCVDYPEKSIFDAAVVQKFISRRIDIHRLPPSNITAAVRGERECIRNLLKAGRTMQQRWNSAHTMDPRKSGLTRTQFLVSANIRASIFSTEWDFLLNPYGLMQVRRTFKKLGSVFQSPLMEWTDGIFQKLHDLEAAYQSEKLKLLRQLARKPHQGSETQGLKEVEELFQENNKKKGTTVEQWLHVMKRYDPDPQVAAIKDVLWSGIFTMRDGYRSLCRTQEFNPEKISYHQLAKIPEIPDADKLALEVTELEQLNPAAHAQLQKDYDTLIQELMSAKDDFHELFLFYCSHGLALGEFYRQLNGGLTLARFLAEADDSPAESTQQTAASKDKGKRRKNKKKNKAVPITENPERTLTLEEQPASTCGDDTRISANEPHGQSDTPPPESAAASLAPLTLAASESSSPTRPLEQGSSWQYVTPRPRPGARATDGHVTQRSAFDNTVLPEFAKLSQGHGWQDVAVSRRDMRNGRVHFTAHQGGHSGFLSWDPTQSTDTMVQDLLAIANDINRLTDAKSFKSKLTHVCYHARHQGGDIRAYFADARAMFEIIDPRLWKNYASIEVPGQWRHRYDYTEGTRHRSIILTTHGPEAPTLADFNAPARRQLKLFIYVDETTAAYRAHLSKRLAGYTATAAAHQA